MSRARAMAVLLAGTAVLAASGTPSATRLGELRDEIERLKGDAARLAGQEHGLLGEIATMDAAIALRRAEEARAQLELQENERALSLREGSLADLDAQQERRKPALAKSLRALYTRGTVGALRDMLESVPGAGRRDGIRYADLLAHRDASRIEAWRSATRRLASERAALDAERSRLAAARDEAARASATLEASRAQRARAVARIRGDREQHERAIAELEAAAQGLTRVVPEGVETVPAGALDVRTFRGLLDWPAEGTVSARFGPTIHPRFKTSVPHPGWDIDAPEGSPFRCVFDGRVAYAAALHGYGLTVVVDHGQGIASVYAHAAVLLVEAGDTVARGEELGRVGESGSLRGPYLYFEIREAGKPADPRGWLRAK